MKQGKVLTAVMLLAAFLLSSCAMGAPNAKEVPAEPAVEMIPQVRAEEPAAVEAAPLADAAESGYFLQPLAVNGGVDAVTADAKPLFKAKFEGDRVEGSGEAVDGVYRFTAAKTDGEAWHVKLESNYPTVAGRDYQVTYRFISDVAGKVKFGDFQEFEIQKGENSVTGMLIATGGTSYLDLQLGMLPPSRSNSARSRSRSLPTRWSTRTPCPGPLTSRTKPRSMKSTTRATPPSPPAAKTK